VFVLTHMADVVRNSDEPYIGSMLFAALVIILVFIIVLTVKDIRK
jgi:hypothetical protein